MKEVNDFIDTYKAMFPLNIESKQSDDSVKFGSKKKKAYFRKVAYFSIAILFFILNYFILNKVAQSVNEGDYGIITVFLVQLSLFFSFFWGFLSANLSIFLINLLSKYSVWIKKYSKILRIPVCFILMFFIFPNPLINMKQGLDYEKEIVSSKIKNIFEKKYDNDEVRYEKAKELFKLSNYAYPKYLQNIETFKQYSLEKNEKIKKSLEDSSENKKIATFSMIKDIFIPGNVENSIIFTRNPDFYKILNNQGLTENLVKKYIKN